MSLRSLVKTLVPIVFGVGLVLFGITAFVRASMAQRQFEGTMQDIRAGKIQPETLVVVRKYVDSGTGVWPHIVFSSGRKTKVDVAATRDFFNDLNPGDTTTGYYIEERYFIPQNHVRDSGLGKWFLPGTGVLLGAGTLAFAFANAGQRTTCVDKRTLQAIFRDPTDNG